MLILCPQVRYNSHEEILMRSEITIVLCYHTLLP